MVAIEQIASEVSLRQACRALGVSRATLHRRRRPPTQRVSESPHPRTASPLRLTEQERQQMLDLLHSERFVDASPAQIYATLLDENRYLCSERTMYRLLAQDQELRERRRQLRHPSYRKPELLATGPNQVWSWDITKLRGPGKWTYYSLYVVLDIFSRYVVAWLLAERESTLLAQQLVSEAVERFHIPKGQLTFHADRGSIMKAKSLALLLADLGILRTHNRPYTSNDNPYSEAHFKTLKYHPHFPDRFGSLQDARAFCANFFDWYNYDHRHDGVALLTPSDVHFGRAQEVIAARTQVLHAAYQLHPERFRRGRPVHRKLPTEVWINQPTRGENRQNSTGDSPIPEQPWSHSS